MEYFKIRNKDGLFYKSNYTWQGHRVLYWHKKGHEFKQLKQVHDSIEKNSRFENCKQILSECEIVKFEVKEIEIIKIN